MNIKEILKNVDLKKVAVFVGAVITGVSAASGILTDHKKEQKLNELEKIVTELQKK